MNRAARQNHDAMPSGELRDWYRSTAGSGVVARVRSVLDLWVPQLFGYHALQIGDLGAELDLLESSRILHRVTVDPSSPEAGLRALPDQLPIQTDSVDLVLLSHALEFSAQPHQVLREVDRVLVPEGHVLIVGFNPLSLFGLWRLVLARRRRVPWTGRFYSPYRVKDWLSVLGFKAVSCEYLAFSPPVQRVGLQRRLAWLERLGSRWWPYLGGAYVVLARKQVITLTPVKPRWRPRRAILAGNLTEPSTRVRHEHERAA